MLTVKNISFSYKQAPVISNISFEMKPGENVALVGESGSGKSTLLKLIYGNYDLDSGNIFWNHQELFGPKYNLVIGYDFIKYLSQEFDLMPFTTVAENIGKYLSPFHPENKQRRIEELIHVVELEEFTDTKVKWLSGGQKQRVALAQALAKQPELLLLDEPFSHIDSFKKQALRRKVFRFLKEQNISCLVATHDKNDVLGFADRVLVLHDQKIIENSSVEHLYQKPKSRWVAAFFGEYNYIEPFGIVYAHQLKIVAHSPLKAVVKQCYFNGKNYLIEADFNATLIYIEHAEQIDTGTAICFEKKM
ncbi:MAG: ABC transporter ATP-binding protein [Flavobacteriaceae bacterium]|nr:ABC transporter ATP-binding protein [Flavobacteriaceae bacterium]